MTKILSDVRSLITSIAQNQEDFYAEQREVNGKLIRAIHGEEENKVPGLIKDMVYMKQQASIQKAFRNKALWVTIGFGIAITFFEGVLHFKEFISLIK